MAHKVVSLANRLKFPMTRLVNLCGAVSWVALSVVDAQMEIQSGGTIHKLNPPPGGPGSSYQRAIPITAPDETRGVKMEYAYLARNYPGATPLNHSREWYTGRRYDVITFTTSAGQKRTLFFAYSVHRE